MGVLCGALGLFQHFDLFSLTRTNAVLCDLDIYASFKPCPLFDIHNKILCISVFLRKLLKILCFLEELYYWRSVSHVCSVFMTNNWF